MEFNKFFKGQLKRVAQNVYPSIEKKNRLQKKIDELVVEIDNLDKFITANEVAIKEVTGYSVVDLVEREVVDTGKKDKEGKPIKQTKYNLKYPETVIPVKEPTIPFEEAAPVMTEDVFNPESEVTDNNNINLI